jgi:hypothetical protein
VVERLRVIRSGRRQETDESQLMKTRVHPKYPQGPAVLKYDKRIYRGLFETWGVGSVDKSGRLERSKTGVAWGIPVIGPWVDRRDVLQVAGRWYDGGLHRPYTGRNVTKRGWA